MEEKLQTLQRWLEESERVVFFGGAGVSTDRVPKSRLINRIK